MATAKPSPQPVAVLRGHTAAVNDVAFLPASEVLVSGATDGELRAWDVETRRTTSSHSGHGGSGVLAVHPFGANAVLSQGRDGRVVLWDMGAGGWQPTQEERCTSYNFCRCAWDPVKGLLFLPTEDSTVEAIDLRARGHCGRYTAEARDKMGLPMHLAVSAGYFLCAAFESGHVAIWDHTGGPPSYLQRLHTEPALTVAFGPTRRHLATGGADNALLLCRWDHPTVTLQERFEGTHGVASCCFRDDGRLLAAGSWDHRVRIYDARKHRPLAVLRHHTAAINAVRYATDSDLLATAAADHEVALWRLYPMRSCPDRGAEVSPEAPALNPDDSGPSTNS